MSATAPIGVGVIGLGFIGRHHVRAYQAAVNDGFPCRLVAVCDPQWGAGSGASPASQHALSNKDDQPLFDPKKVRICRTADELIADPTVQVVSICTYTDTHVDLALKALAAGKHVLVEKPIALKSMDVTRLADAARRAKTLCMPAMCMRFWPGWDWLHDRIHDQSFGKVRSAVFQRLGSSPAWAREFYGDPTRSGGALFDLHIHDVDFLHWCFGRPQSIISHGSLMHMTTQYRFADGPPHVTAEGAWDLAPSAGFRMRYLVAFENATADFDINRTPRLILHTADQSKPIELEDSTGYDGEVRAFIRAIQDESPLRATIDDAVAVTELLEAERQSMERGEPMRISGQIC